MVQDIEPLGVGGHDAVLDAVMDHLDEVAPAAGPAVQVAQLRCAADLLTPWGARDGTESWGEGLEDGVEILDGPVRPADHHAVAALQPPDAAAGADVDIVNPPRGEFLGPADIVDVVGVAAVDQDVVLLQ